MIDKREICLPGELIFSLEGNSEVNSLESFKIKEQLKKRSLNRELK